LTSQSWKKHLTRLKGGKEENMADMQITLDKEKLEGTMTREFDAPREKLWHAHTDAKAIEQWWGPRKYQTKVETLEPKVGGKWKFLNIAGDEKYVFYGEFREVVEPERITWTFIYEPYPDAEIVETITFEELAGDRTKVHVVSKYPSIESFEGMVQGGMEEGARETWDRLAELVEKS
jgi:uncharacterized protein YndB with AHSA1/START domain